MITDHPLCLLSYDGIMVGEDGVEPPEPEGMRFTVSPATVYGILSHVASPQGFEPWLPVRKNGLAIRRIKPLCHDDMALSEGFEPSDLSANGVQSRLLKPLGQLSTSNFQKVFGYFSVRQIM